MIHNQLRSYLGFSNPTNNILCGNFNYILCIAFVVGLYFGQSISHSVLIELNVLYILLVSMTNSIRHFFTD